MGNTESDEGMVKLEEENHLASGKALGFDYHPLSKENLEVILLTSLLTGKEHFRFEWDAFRRIGAPEECGEIEQSKEFHGIQGQQ